MNYKELNEVIKAYDSLTKEDLFAALGEAIKENEELRKRLENTVEFYNSKIK